MTPFLKPTLLALAALGCFATAAQANVLTYSGNTTSSATFDRPLEDLSDLSGVGTAVHYSTLTFTASLSGTYSFLTTTAFDDAFSILYSGVFNPAAPLTHALVANDDLFTTLSSVSGFTYDLVAGTTYSYVSTGFNNTDFGGFTATVGGPGLISAVPEPSSWALMALGIGAVGLVGVGRKRSAKAEAALAA